MYVICDATSQTAKLYVTYSFQIMQPLYVIWGYNCFILDRFSTQMLADLKLAHELSSIQA